MNKLVLNDGTVLDVINPLESCFQIEQTSTDMVDTFNKLNVDNLSHIELQNEAGEVMAIFENKKPKSCSYDAETGIATFVLDDVDLIGQQIKDIQDTLDTLVMSDLEV